MKRTILGGWLLMVVGAVVAGVPAAVHAADETTPVWQVLLAVQVCDVSNAGTDNVVQVRLNAGNLTGLDHPWNDFERADSRTYPLLLTGVARLQDISLPEGGQERHERALHPGPLPGRERADDLLRLLRGEVARHQQP